MDVISEKKKDVFWTSTLIVLLVFVFFLIIKINGFFDWTRSFDIECIQCRENYNWVFLIDQDSLTTWGILDSDHTQGEVITLIFHNTRQIGRLELDNCSRDETKPINIYYSLNGNDYIFCGCSFVTDSEKMLCIFDEKIMCKYLKIEYAADNPGTWPITEITVYD